MRLHGWARLQLTSTRQTVVRGSLLEVTGQFLAWLRRNQTALLHAGGEVVDLKLLLQQDNSRRTTPSCAASFTFSMCVLALMSQPCCVSRRRLSWLDHHDSGPPFFLGFSCIRRWAEDRPWVPPWLLVGGAHLPLH
jgi:hypothetical protein